MTTTEDVWATAPPATPEPPAPRRTPVNGHAADRLPPHDIAAERAVLGALLLRPDLVDAVDQVIRDDDWYRLDHRLIYETIVDRHAARHPVDTITIAAAIGTHRTLQGSGGPLYINDLANDPNVLPDQATWHAGIIAARGHERRTVELGTWLTQAGHSAADTDVVRQRLELHLAQRGRSAAGLVTVRDVDQFLGDDHDEQYDWVVPGLLERHDRLMLTGPEGGGKSTFCRQFAIMAAAGLHPFTGEVIDPARVLYVDLENSERQSRRKLRPLRIQAGPLLAADQLYVEVRPSGVDLLTREDTAWLLSLVDATRPDILITGPIYRMASGDPTEEKTAKPVSQALDQVRERGCAVIIETHTPHATGGQRKRPTRPYGASLWLRWPEFGIHLAEDGEIEHWRGARDEREWPTLLSRGGHWPWTPVSDPAAVLWARIRQVREEFGQPMTVRDIADATGASKTTIHRALQSRRPEWETINGGLDE